LKKTREKILVIEMNRRDTEKVSSVVRRMHIDIDGGGKSDIGSEAIQLHIQRLRMICNLRYVDPMRNICRASRQSRNDLDIVFCILSF
jgi:hypothetical protein